jgi:O-antigen/teichoic acid export membrane protein
MWLLLVILTKSGTVETVGVFAVAQAISLPINMLFGLRLQVAQITDARNDYQFGHYYALRIITMIMAVIVTAIIGFLYYPKAVAIVTLLLAVNYALVSAREIFLSFMQKCERMDKTSISAMLQGLLSLLLFGVTFWLSKNLALSVVGLIAARLIVFYVYDMPVVRKLLHTTNQFDIISIKPLWNIKDMWRLTKLTASLGIVGWMSQLFNSIPRLILDKYAGVKEVGYFAAISSLLVAGGMIATAVGQAVCPRLAKYYVEDRRFYKRLFSKFLAVSFMLGIAGIFISILFGRAILTLVFKADYAEYNNIFVQLTIAGAVLFLFSAMNVALTTARKFAIQIPIYAFSVVVCGIAAFLLIPHYGMMGATWSLLICYFTGFAGCLFFWIRTVKKNGSGQKEES